jgi:hypothetical protein
MDSKVIQFRQLCALTKSILVEDLAIDDSEWKARIKARLVKWGFRLDVSDAEMVNRAMTAVEHALTKQGIRRESPLPVETPTRTKTSTPREFRTHHPPGWALVEKLLAGHQGLKVSAPSSVREGDANVIAKRTCLGCQQDKPVDPTTSLCVDCLIVAVRERRNAPLPEDLPFDPKQAAAGKDAD